MLGRHRGRPGAASAGRRLAGRFGNARGRRGRGRHVRLDVVRIGGGGVVGDVLAPMAPARARGAQLASWVLHLGLWWPWGRCSHGLVVVATSALGTAVLLPYVALRGRLRRRAHTEGRGWKRRAHGKLEGAAHSGRSGGGPDPPTEPRSGEVFRLVWAHNDIGDAPLFCRGNVGVAWRPLAQHRSFGQRGLLGDHDRRLGDEVVAHAAALAEPARRLVHGGEARRGRKDGGQDRCGAVVAAVVGAVVAGVHGCRH